MWIYERKLEYPVKIRKPDPRAASIIVSQLGGPDGELGASMRYLNQRYSMPYRDVAGILTDIGTEELAHLEIVAAILRQLTRGLDAETIAKSPLAPYFVDHTGGIYPQSAGGMPFSMAAVGIKGDAITDLHEDMAADGTTTKEQPVKTKCRKPLILLDFSAFSGCTSLTALQPYKDNKRLKSSKSYER